MTNQGGKPRLSILALALVFPLSLRADPDAPRPLDSWELADNSLKFRVETILAQPVDGDEPIPATPSVTLELYQGHFYKLSILTEAAEGYAFPDPGPPVHGPPPSTRAMAGFGYYSTQSDTLRFHAHYLKLFANGKDLEELIEQSGDAGALEEFKFVLSLVNGLYLDLFNHLYAYESGDRLVFLLPAGSPFTAGMGDPAGGVVWELERSGPPPSSSMTAVEATVPGDQAAGLTIEFARSIAGRAVHYAWGGITDEAGRVELDLSTLDRSGATGFYRARASDRAGEVVGQWHSIPLNRDRLQVLELVPGGRARVVSSRPLEAAKAVAGREPVAAGLASNYPNPFNSSTRIEYGLAAAGRVRLGIYNVLGQPVRTLVDEETQDAGMYQVEWDARDQRGAAVAAGVYLTRLVYPGGVETRRLLYLK